MLYGLGFPHCSSRTVAGDLLAQMLCHMVILLLGVVPYMCADLRLDRTINCSSQNYPAVPCPLDSDAMVLDLSHNRITRISRLDFSQATDLRRLHLQFNQIGSVDREAFLLHPRLEYLDLSHNQLQDISAVPLRNAPSLRHLDLRGNVYTQLRLGAWLSRLSRLRVLRLGNDKVVSLLGRLLARPQLEELHLVTGKLQHYDGSLSGLWGLDQVTLELGACGCLRAEKEIANDLLNATRALTLANVNAMATEVGCGGVEQWVPALAGSGLRGLTLQNVTTSECFCEALFTELAQSAVEDLTVEGAVSSGRCVSRIPPFHRSRLTSLRIRDVDNPKAYIFRPEDSVVKFFQTFHHLSLINARLSLIPCVVSQSLLRLTVLDVSRNALQLFSLFPGCVSPFPVVSSLTLDGNRLSSIMGLAHETLHMYRLVTLSANQNQLGDAVGPAQWTGSLRKLFLRENGLPSAVIPTLPSTLTVLDLSVNDITTVTGLEKMKGLVQLLLSHNKLLSLDGIPMRPPLSVLYVDHNLLSEVNGTLLAALGQASLKMGSNPFLCDCQTLSQFHHTLSSTRILDWPEGYFCHAPEGLRGAELHSLQLQQCKATSSLPTVLLLLISALISLSLTMRYASCCRAERLKVTFSLY